MNIKETCDKLALIGLRGSVQGTGSADYVRIFVMDARNVTLGPHYYSQRCVQPYQLVLWRHRSLQH